MSGLSSVYTGTPYPVPRRPRSSGGFLASQAASYPSCRRDLASQKPLDRRRQVASGTGAGPSTTLPHVPGSGVLDGGGMTPAGG